MDAISVASIMRKNMYQTILLLLFCIINAEAGIQKSFEDKVELGFKYYPDVGWIHYHQIPTTWAEARLRCYYEGGVMLSPINEPMKKALSELSKTSIWTGVHATYSKLNYFSVKGEPLSKMPVTWAPGEPNNENNNEECLVMVPGGKIADCSCNETYTFACYKTNNFKTALCGHLSGYELDQTTNSCYKFHNVAQNWSRAFMICAEEGAHLAVIDTVGEAEVLKQLYSKYPDNVIKGGDFNHFIHLGFRDWDDHSIWMTINGKSIDDLVNDKIASWGTKEPNNQGKNEFCGCMRRDGALNDLPCFNKAPFICEYEKK